MQLIRKLGEGQGAQVYLGRLVDGDYVSVKIFSIKSSTHLGQINNEVNVLKYLSLYPDCHPHILCFREFIRQGQSASIVTNYIPGITLKEYISNLESTLINDTTNEDHGPQRAQQVRTAEERSDETAKRNKWVTVITPNLISLCLQIASSVLFIHSRGIVHRDIKPANIIISNTENEQEEASLIDFGLACAVENIPNIYQCQLKFVGTPNFLAPELWTAPRYGRLYNDPSYAYKVDIYALGVIFYQMFNAGSVPYVADSINELKPLVLNAEIPSPDTSIQSLNDLVISMLQKDPKDRPTASDIVRILSSI